MPLPAGGYIVSNLLKHINLLLVPRPFAILFSSSTLSALCRHWIEDAEASSEARAQKRFHATTMDSTNVDPTHAIDTHVELPPPPVPEARLEPTAVHDETGTQPTCTAWTRFREVAGAQPMDTAWEQLWSEGVIPWDTQSVTPVVAQLLRENKLRPGRVLVPGCGTGYDVIAMAGPTRAVLGLDISRTAVQQAKQVAAKSPNAAFAEFRVADFFAFAPKPEEKFDVVFDYTFFCALEPRLRPAWAQKMADVLAADGELMTLMFMVDEHEGGPPFTVSMTTYERVLAPLGFRLTVADSDIPSLEARKGREMLMRWQRADSQA